MTSAKLIDAIGPIGLLIKAGAGALRPERGHCSDHAIGRSIKRLTPKPRGSRPSIAALTRAGQRKASDSVMRIERSVLPLARGDAIRWSDSDLLSARPANDERREALRVRTDARFGSHRPDGGEWLAFALDDLATPIGRWRRPWNGQDAIWRSPAIGVGKLISIAVRLIVTRSMAARRSHVEIEALSGRCGCGAVDLAISDQRRACLDRAVWARARASHRLDHASLDLRRRTRE